MIKITKKEVNRKKRCKKKKFKVNKIFNFFKIFYKIVYLLFKIDYFNVDLGNEEIKTYKKQ